MSFPSVVFTITDSGLGCTSTFSSPTIAFTGCEISRRLISGAAYSRSTSAGVNGKSGPKLTGFKVTRMLCSPAGRMSSCAGWLFVRTSTAGPAVTATSNPSTLSVERRNMERSLRPLSLRTSKDYAFLHYKDHVVHGADVFQRIATDCDDVGEFLGLDGAKAFVDSEQPGGFQRRRLNGPHGRHATGDH